MRRITIISLLVIVLLTGCAQAYGFREHWRSRVAWICESPDAPSAGFELDLFGKYYPQDVHAALISGRRAGIADHEIMLPESAGAAWRAWQHGLKAELDNNFDAALKNYTRAFEMNPQETQFTGTLMKCSLKCGDFVKAGNLSASLESARHSKPLPYRLDGGATGFGLLLSGDNEEVVRRLMPRLGHAGLDADYFLALSIACIKLEQYEKAVKVLFTGKNSNKLNRECMELFGKALHRWLRELRKMKMFSTGRRLAERAVKLFPNEEIMYAHLALFMEQQGDYAAAGRLFEQALEINPYNIEVVKAAREHFVERGKFVRAYEIWKRMVPHETVFSPENLLIKKIENIEKRSRSAENAAPDSPEMIELARAYRNFGWLLEAEKVYERILKSNPLHRMARVESIELKRHMIVIERISKYFNMIYERLFEGKSVPDIEEAILDMEKIIRKTALTDPGANECWSAAFFGSELNPMSSKSSGIVEYFAHFNQYIEIQQTYMQHPECKIMNVVYREKVKRNVLGRDTEYEVYIGDETWVKTTAGYLSARPRVAGSATYSGRGYYIDLSAIRPDLEKVRSIVHLPIPHHDMPYLEYARRRFCEKGGRDGIFFSGGLRERLNRKACDSLGVKPGDPSPENLRRAFQKFFHAEVNSVCEHELGHVRDFKSFIPFLAHLPNNLWTVVANGFSPLSIVTRFETIAEMHALALSVDPHFHLAGGMDWLESMHEKPYHQLLYIFPLENVAKSPYHYTAINLFRAVVEHVKDYPDKFPQIDFNKNVYLQVDKIDAATIRRVARRELGPLGGE